MKPLFKQLPLISALLSAHILTPAAFAADEQKTIELDELIVSADFRPAKASETAVSLTEIDEETIESRGATHLEEVLNLAPNVNLSAGASRGQFFQIRGMGVRSRFDEAPTNPSVGLIIDGVDFSRIGSAGTLFDVESLEILRGPQGTRFGTNALAGTVFLRSKEPTKDFNLHMETGFAEYNTRNLGLAVGGTLIEDSVLGRAAIYSHQSDGYMDNDFLGRDNTNNQDELTLRGKLKFLVSDDFTVDLSYLHLDIDNGYDAFTRDNSRTSQANQPGEDKNRSNAIAVKTNWQANNGVTIQTESSYLKADTLYSFDWDWIDDNFSASYDRERKNASFDVRALSGEKNRIFGGSTDWTIGLFHFDQDEANDVRDDFGDTFTSDYDTKNTAIYGQLDTHISDKLTLVTGLRVEKFDADYSDTRSINIDTDETMFGGKLGITYQVDEDNLFFSTLSRGYKSGGVNNVNNAALIDDEREFDTEYNYTLETGIKSFWLNRRMMTDLTVFYTKRRDAQISNSVQLSSGGFETLTSNATNALHKGVEASVDWLVTDKVRVLGSLGILDAKFDNYSFEESATSTVVLGDRQVAHAPNYTFSLGTELYPNSNWTIRANVEGKDDFYFSDTHNAKSSSYAVVNASADYTHNQWRVSVWARNLFDRNYYNRGFFFDFNPPFNNPSKYVQRAEPRVAGITVSYDY